MPMRFMSWQVLELDRRKLMEREGFLTGVGYRQSVAGDVLSLVHRTVISPLEQK